MKAPRLRSAGHGAARESQNFWRLAPRTGSIFLLAATATGLYFCARLAQPFLSPIAWSLALAILFLPLHRRFEARLRSRGWAALCAVLAAGLLVVVPAVFVGQRLAIEAAQGAELLKTKLDSGAWRRALDNHPRLAAPMELIEKKMDLPGAIQGAVAQITSLTAAALRSSVIELIRVVLTFYLLFYMLRDHNAALQAVKSISPLTGEEMDQLFAQIGDTIHATIYGTATVAAVQGMLGGAIFWWLGFPAPLFWGIIMALLAIVPVLGAFVVWVPAACFLALDGEWGNALLLTIWGTVVIGLIDNWLYPILVGRRLKMHSMLAFISTVGGLIVFGASGLILGPVTLIVTLFLLRIWRKRS